MKSYWGDREIRLVGRAWEIRHRLRRLALREQLPGTTLGDVLMRRGENRKSRTADVRDLRESFGL